MRKVTPGFLLTDDQITTCIRIFGKVATFELKRGIDSGEYKKDVDEDWHMAVKSALGEDGQDLFFKLLRKCALPEYFKQNSQ